MRALNLLFFCFLVSATVQAQSRKYGLNEKNGNFWYTETELFAADGIDTLWVSRTYNSKSTSFASYGAGWGYFYDTYLQFSGDGTIVLRYYGAGGTTVMNPLAGKDSTILQSVKLMHREAMQHEEVEADPVVGVRYVNGLFSNETQRQVTWNRYRKLGWLDPVVLKQSTEYKSARGKVSLKVSGDSLICYQPEGECWIFDPEGYLILRRVGGEKDEKIYRHGKQLDSIVKGKAVLRFRYGSNGRIASVSNGEQQIDYFYNQDGSFGNGLLLKAEAKWAEGNRLAYQYDDNFCMMNCVENGDTMLQVEYARRTVDCKGYRDGEGIGFQFHYGYYYDASGKVDSRHYYFIKKNLLDSRDSVFWEFDLGRNAFGGSYNRMIRASGPDVFKEWRYRPDKTLSRFILNDDTLNFRFSLIGRIDCIVMDTDSIWLGFSRQNIRSIAIGKDTLHFRYGETVHPEALRVNGDWLPVTASDTTLEIGTPDFTTRLLIDQYNKLIGIMRESETFDPEKYYRNRKRIHYAESDE